MDVTPDDRQSALEPGRDCWRIERCERASLIVDAAEYFRLARQAMMRAQKQILLIGWDFDTRITLDHDAHDGAPTELGALLSWLPEKTPGLHIYILKWDVGAIKLFGRGTTILRIGRWALDRDISFKLDGAHPAGACHHHKIAVLDDQLAFCGGIDMTAERWDTRRHLDHDDRRKRPLTRRRYGPWHDATMAVDGDVAAALGDLARKRWQIAGGSRIDPPTGTQPLWPEQLEPDFRDAQVAISRTRAAYRERKGLREIEKLFVEQIKCATKYVYIENQYFASRVVAQAIAERLSEENGPEFIVVNPRSGEDWLDEETMSPARARLMQLIESADRKRRFRIYTPVTENGQDIYVHSKILIADDLLLRVGSANLNNRSMGLDSECDLTVDCRLDGNGQASGQISKIRNGLLAEHLGVSAEAVQAHFQRSNSLISTVEALRGNARTLVPFVPEKPNKLEREIADNEIADPESNGDQFEPMARPGLFAGFKSLLQRN